MNIEQSPRAKATRNGSDNIPGDETVLARTTEEKEGRLDTAVITNIGRRRDTIDMTEEGRVDDGGRALHHEEEIHLPLLLTMTAVHPPSVTERMSCRTADKTN